MIARWTVLALLIASPPVLAASPWLPKAPDTAHCKVDHDTGKLSNAVLRFSVSAAKNGLRPRVLDNRFTDKKRILEGELFSLAPRSDSTIPASTLRVTSKLSCERIRARTRVARAAARRSGVALHATLSDKHRGLSVDWRLVLRDGTNYVREIVTLHPTRKTDLATISLIDLQLEGARVVGTVKGSPIVAGDAFFGFEQPMARARALGGHATMTLERKLPLRANIPVTYSAVFGVAPAGQLRRGFDAYLDNERAHPYRQFLHYNSWYDIGYFNRYDQDDALKAINAFGEQMAAKRGVDIKSFLFDDGWDDPENLWTFNKGFPHGFKPLEKAARKYGAGLGVWLSPWGGYGPPRKKRLATARKDGFRVDKQGIALSAPKYYSYFHNAVMGFLNHDGINLFKLDGTGSPDKMTPGSRFDSDFAAAIALIEDMRRARPDVFINLTTGTWPSPFWLGTADSIYRGGWDHSFTGVGSDRERWVTYRDGQTYGNIVRKGPLFPLNSLMLHGVIYARHAQGLHGEPGESFAHGVWDYFATGTDLQGLYVSPDLMSKSNWDTLARAAKWATSHKDVLRDSHWIGGDPARLQVYGYAAWQPGAALVTLRNPGDKKQTWELDLGKALNLPPAAKRDWTATSPNVEGIKLHLQAGKRARITLAPFEVLVLDLTPEA